MGDFSRRIEQSENDTYEDDEEDEEQRARPMLNILFGNVDDSGDLDEEYLDQDAKEHLSALAGKLGQSFVDVELSARRKESGALSDVSEEKEDYGKKADDAVDYEDIEEQYEGPEVQIPFQDEQAISQDQKYYAEHALAGPSSKVGVFVPEEENYDEEDDYDKEGGYGGDENYQQEVDEKESGPVEEDDQPVFVQEASKSGPVMLPFATEDPNGGMSGHETFTEECVAQLEYSMLEEEAYVHEVSPKVDFPVLYEEDGKEVLRFSELFGHQEPPWVCKKERRHQKVSLLKGKASVGQSEVCEEDEDVLLKSSSVGKITIDEAQVIAEEPIDSESHVDDEDIEFSDSSKVVAGSNNANLQMKLKRYLCESAQPMKEERDGWHSILERTTRVPSPNLHPIHQEDWEAAILWDREHVHHVRGDPLDNAIESSGEFEEMDIDTREEDAFCMGEKDELLQDSMGQPVSEDIRNGMAYQRFRPVLIEPLCRTPSLKGSQTERARRHPQLLRLEAMPVLKEAEAHLGAKVRGDKVAEIVHSFQKLNVQNPDLLSGSWLDHVIWDDEGVTSAKLQCSNIILDLQDDQMVFEIPEGNNGQHMRAHAAAMVVTPRIQSTTSEAADGHNLGHLLSARFNISNDKYYMNKKNSQQQKSSTKKRALHGIKVMHSLPAIKLQTMKPKLTNKDLANFHRPKAIWYPHHNEVAAKEQGKLSVAGPMKVILKTMGGKGSKLYVDASETLEAVKVKSTKKFGDAKTSERTKIYYSGKELEDGKTLAQQEVKPNSVLHLVRTKVYAWTKAQRLPGENKPTRPPGAFKRKSDLSVKDGHVFLAEYCEERPLLLSNVGMGARLSTYYRKLTSTDSTAATLRNERGSSVGIPLPLEPTEDSPFLGDIRPGDTQSCLETNMYRAPAFHHKVPHADFLLVRSAKGKLSLRRIDNILVIGQQEPHMEVLTPGSKTIQSYFNNRLLVYMYREFRNNEKPGSSPRVRADEVTAQFPSLSEGYLRKRLKHCADLQKSSGGEMWWIMRQNFRIPSEEELRRMMNPENVCSYESMQAGLHHLKRMGLHKLTQPSGLSAAMNQLPDEAIVLAAASHIERELQLTPWNLSCNFVAATMQGRGSLERLEITGAGDPSGRGLGFSYLRAAPKAPGSGALVEKKAAAARGGGAVTGTDADLRRLSMDAAREVLLKFNVPEGQIEKMTRWHRIALVRKLSSEQAASGVKVGVAALNKFARGQRMSFLQLQQQTREKCQEIWDRQAQSLSAVDGDNCESEVEGNEDLDSFAGDLENLLEAEEGETEEVASQKLKKEAIRGTGARRRALEAQREEDIEDEEAEAAELRRMLMEDDEADDGKKKKKSVNIGKEKKDKEDFEREPKMGTPDVSKSNVIRKKKKIIKRIIRTKKPDGTYTEKAIIITDPKEVAQYLAKKNATQNGSSGKDKKAALPAKKEKKAAPTKDGKKPKKLTKGEAGRDGLQLVCGACKQLGHMRTNKKVCPLYMEDGKATLQKTENADAAEPSVRQGIKFTLKNASGQIQEKDRQLGHVDSPMAQKIPCLKIKLPVPGNIDSTSGSIFRLNQSNAISNSNAPEGHVRSPTGDALKEPENKSTGVVKKIRFQKKHKKKENVLEDARNRESSIANQLDSSQDVDNQALLDREYIRNQRQHELELEAVREKELRKQGEEAVRQRDIEEKERVKRERIEEEIRMQMEKQKLKEEKEKRRAKQREDKRKKREEEERERLRIEILKENARLAEIQKQMELEEAERLAWAEKQREKLERQLQLERLEKMREQQRQLELERQREAREQEERERQKQRREKEKQKLEERVQPKRPVQRDRRLLDTDRSMASKRRACVEVGVSRRVPDYAPQTKRRKGGEVQLANILESVVDILRKQEISFLFLKPVTKKEAPDYLQMIKNPMDLSTIREKTRKMQYKCQEEFRCDVWQIAENAHIYNDHRHPHIPPLADRLLELCDELLEERNEKLVEAESAIERIDEENMYATPSHALNRRISRH